MNTVTVCVKEAIKMGSFPDIQIVNHFDKKNYRPVCILPLLSKVYERGIYKQVSNFFELFFSETLRRFRKALST